MGIVPCTAVVGAGRIVVHETDARLRAAVGRRASRQERTLGADQSQRETNAEQFLQKGKTDHGVSVVDLKGILLQSIIFTNIRRFRQKIVFRKKVGRIVRFAARGKGQKPKPFVSQSAAFEVRAEPNKCIAS